MHIQAHAATAAAIVPNLVQRDQLNALTLFTTWNPRFRVVACILAQSKICLTSRLESSFEARTKLHKLVS